MCWLAGSALWMAWRIGTNTTRICDFFVNYYWFLILPTFLILPSKNPVKLFCPGKISQPGFLQTLVSDHNDGKCMYSICDYDLVFQLEDRDSLYVGFGIVDTDQKGEIRVVRRSMGWAIKSTAKIFKKYLQTKPFAKLFKSQQTRSQGEATFAPSNACMFPLRNTSFSIFLAVNEDIFERRMSDRGMKSLSTAEDDRGSCTLEEIGLVTWGGVPPLTLFHSLKSFSTLSWTTGSGH